MFRPSLILLGLVVGIVLGLIYGWVISPVQYTETDPSTLNTENREQYILLVASAYRADHNIDRARMRLAKLQDADVISDIAALAQRAAANGQDASALAVLASDLSGGLAGVATATPAPSFTPDVVTPIVDTPTAPVIDATATNIPAFPTLTPTVPADYDYALITREAYCDDDQRQPLIIADVIDSSGAPLPGVRVTVLWADGQDGFVTGLKPEISPSYGDFLMEVGTTYSVQLGARTPPITGLSAPSCLSQIDNSQYAGAIRLVFQRQ
jgi:hypothetical protein